MTHSKLVWKYQSWNPVTGCSKISLGCLNCYAERFAKRLKAIWNPKYRNWFEVMLHPEVLDYPKKLKHSSMIFVNSMSDLFHEKVPLEFIQKVFDVMNSERRHIFQVLTKRAERLAQLAYKLEWWENIWMGVTVEHHLYKYRIDLLRKIPAKVKFLSLEPLLSNLWELDLWWIDWVIVWWESWPWARPIKEERVWNIKEQCEQQNVSFYFKQRWWVNKKKTGRLLRWKFYIEYPKEVFEWQRRYWLKGAEVVE